LKNEKHISYNRVLQNSFLPSFVTLLPPIRSEYDFDFRPWGESLGCVQTPCKELKVTNLFYRAVLDQNWQVEQKALIS